LTGVLADSPKRFTVVLDGYEMASLELAREVDFLLRHTLGRLCLVFVGRVDPVLPLYRYRLMDSVLEIRAADLAFTDVEAAELLTGLGVTLSRASVHELNQRIKGWAAGLRFAGRALVGREHPEASVATVVSQTCDINEYLVGEVLDAQTPEVRRFLLDTCVPRLLSPALVEELGGVKAVRILDELARSNAFIEAVPDQSDLYRYYPFFRELLRAQLAYEDPERMVELHRRTARWLDREGLTEHAIAHLAAIDAWDDVAQHLVRGLLVGRLLLEGPDGPLLAAARELPQDAEHRAGRVVRAAINLRTGDRAAAAHELEAARRTVGPDDAAVALSITVLDAVRAATTDATASAAAAVERAERQLYGESRSRTARESELYALVQLSKGVVMFRTGDLVRARKALTTAIGLDASRRFASFRAECLGHLALIDALEGYLTRAHRTADEAVTVAADAGVPPPDRSPAPLVALAYVALERYELRAAREHVASAVLCRTLPGDHLSRALIEAVIAGLERAGGHLQPGLARLEAAATRAAPTDPWLADYLRVQAARLSVASGRPEQALSELADAEKRDQAESSVVAAAAYAEQGQQEAAAEALGRSRKRQAPLGAQVAGILVEVLQESRGRAPGRARVALDRSLRLAAPEELRRPFREAGPSVQRLLAADPGLLREHPWLNHSGRSGSATVSGQRGPGTAGATRSEPSAQPVETLTAKELEVLGHLEELLTTEEIAEKMFVSVNTVRTHVRSILRKLGVSRRNAAVRKARELGLFDG
jgi:LuxR family maltose regulon positive regulatory protein